MKIELMIFNTAANYGVALQKVFLDRVLIVDINHQNDHRKNSYSIFYHFLRSIKRRSKKCN